ncbi:MotB family protein [Luteitalea sp.]
MIDDESSGGGTPAWVVTFADLMSLLMCFFVLLLSFSELDKAKFKQIAGELSQAFGVQREVPVVETPMGTSAVFTDFSPGRPEPTVLESVKQHSSTDAPNLETNSSKSAVEALADANAADLTAATAAALREALKTAIGEGRLQIESGPKRIVLRVEENGSFASGSADVTPAFETLLTTMVSVLGRVPGTLTVEGHTDDVPIRTARFSSNWDLSAARAAAVANALLRDGTLTSQRLRVQGYAETQPREPNASPEQRARNRRVEVIVDQSGNSDDIAIELERLRQAATGVRRATVSTR